MIDNAVSYQDTAWIIDNSDYGLFLLIAPHKMQGEVLSHFEGSNIAVFNCLEKADRHYSFNELELWIQNNPDKNAYFVQNFQALFLEQQDIHDNLVKFNFSRDMLIRLRKNIIFCVDRATDDLLDRNAFDVYSYFKLKPEFEDDAPELSETPVSWDSGLDVTTEIEIDFDQPRNKLLGQAISYMNQAEMLIQKAKYKEAMNLLAAALKIREKELGEEHPDTATTYDGISRVYDLLGDYKHALHYAEKALTIHEDMLNHSNVTTAASYNNIAHVYDHMGKYGKALEMYNKSLTIKEEILGTSHPDTAITYNDIAAVYDHMGEYDKALEWYNKALAIREKVFGTDHPDTATTYNNIAVVYSHMEEIGKAKLWFNRALTILQRLAGIKRTSKPIPKISIDNDGENFEKKQAKVFISYSWDSEEHTAWVKKLFNDLESAGINVILDHNDLKLGGSLINFMEESIRKCDYVMIILTPKYKEKSDHRIGGVGYEDMIIASELIKNKNYRKFIPILANGTWSASTPIWASGIMGVDMSTKEKYREGLSKLIYTISKTNKQDKSEKRKRC